MYRQSRSPCATRAWSRSLDGAPSRMKRSEAADLEHVLLDPAMIALDALLQVLGDVVVSLQRALNATIDAAHAGESGRVFAVVATEVRDLTGRRTQATAQIGAIVIESRERIRALNEHHRYI
jgi:hypothetical protein